MTTMRWLTPSGHGEFTFAVDAVVVPLLVVPALGRPVVGHRLDLVVHAVQDGHGGGGGGGGKNLKSGLFWFLLTENKRTHTQR